MNSASVAAPSSSSSTFSTLLGSTLESLIHELLHSRVIYPPDSFCLYRHLGVRCHANRVPQVCDYIADFLRVSVPCIVNGTGDCITLVILEEETTDGVVGERTGMTKTVERFVFQFDIADDVVIGNCTSSSVSGIINIEDVDDLQKKEIIQRDADMATDARLQMERSMREVLLRTVAMRKRRRRPGEKAENMSFKLCLHIVEEYDENGKRKRDEYSCPDELLRVLKQGEWLVPDESSCYFPSSAFTPSVNSNSGSDDNGQNLRKGMLRPIKDISVPLCGMKLQLGMEVDPLT